MSIVRVNVFGGPGSGKSTIAAWLFSQLKEAGRKIEHINEWIKTMAWQKSVPTSYDQIYVFAKQLRREDLLVRNGIPIITDSPLPLQLAYVRKNFERFYDPLAGILRCFEHDYPSFNIWLRRMTPYRVEGRYEDLDEAKVLDGIIREQLGLFSGSYVSLNPLDIEERKALAEELCKLLPVSK